MEVRRQGCAGTGGARGQGRSHAVNLAKRGADVAVLDILEEIPSVEYDMSRQEDMDETVKLIEAEDRRVIPVKGDVRSGMMSRRRLRPRSPSSAGLT